MTRDEARAWFVQVLMDKVRQDQYPSATHMALIEESIQRVAESLPRIEPQRG
jgi:hypothetical protein